MEYIQIKKGTAFDTSFNKDKEGAYLAFCFRNIIWEKKGSYDLLFTASVIDARRLIKALQDALGEESDRSFDGKKEATDASEREGNQE